MSAISVELDKEARVNSIPKQISMEFISTVLLSFINKDYQRVQNQHEILQAYAYQITENVRGRLVPKAEVNNPILPFRKHRRKIH